MQHELAFRMIILMVLSFGFGTGLTVTIVTIVTTVTVSRRIRFDNCLFDGGLKNDNSNRNWV